VGLEVLALFAILRKGLGLEDPADIRERVEIGVVPLFGA
jgi:hypothetical protein